LLYLRARYYLPQAGIFTARDPFPGFTTLPVTLRPYLYAAGNPLRYTDPSGKFIFLALLAVAAVGGLVGGVGYYALQMYFNHDPCARWDWKDAVFWGGVGTGIGTLLGVGIYGGWWVGVQAGWWGTAAGGTAVAQPIVQRTSGVWQLPPFQRGTTIHQMLGENLPPNFPVIDRFTNGVATSIKTLNLSAPTYQNIASLTSRIQGYINLLAKFQGAQWLQVQMITARELVLAIPAGSSTPAQLAVLQGLQQYAANLGVTLTIVRIP
jgi:hypothetical protein